MADMQRLDELKPIADEMLAGLHADDALKRRIRAAALTAAQETRRKTPRRTARVLVPALCCAALAVACVGVAGVRRGSAPQPIVQINTITAGNEDHGEGENTTGVQSIAGLSAGANVRAVEDTQESLFASGTGDIPLVTVDGGVYRLLSSPQSIERSQLGGEVGEVAAFTDEPSLASAEAMSAGLSNVASEGGAVYAVAGLDSRTAVAAEVDGSLRVFQRVSYAGKGPGTQTLEDTFGVRGQASALELSGVGTLTGDAANEALNVLLDNATLVSADATARRQYLTVTLSSGLRLQLGVSGDTLVGCGGWSCPEFFEAFEAAL